MTSLAETAAPFIQILMRNRKFYGDSLTQQGGLPQRSYLTGDWGGARDSLTDNGIYTYMGLTQYMEGNLRGGNNQALRANGSFDSFLWLDTAKAGWWSGGGFLFHGETSWAESKNGDVGTLLPSNFDAVNPSADGPDTALSEFYMVQALSENLTMGIGKMDLAATADNNLFANNWRYQFSSTALVNNPQLGAVVPYTTFATYLSAKLSDSLSLVYTLNTQDSKATTGSFETIFNGDMVNSLLLIANTKFGGKPGLLHALVGYASGEQADFAIDRRHAAEELLGLVPIQLTDGNYGVFLSGSQYVRTRESGHRKGCVASPSRPLGWGFFWRYGATPEDRNVISQFASAGIGGYGGPGGRLYDNWGIGWAGSYISPDLRNAVANIERVNVWEHNIEAFYNYRLTPSMHLTYNVQVSDPAIDRIETPVSLGSRLQIDF